MTQTIAQIIDCRRAIGRLLALVMLSLLCCRMPAYAQRAVFVVRHAEKVDNSRDPELSDAGKARALVLARLLKDAGITTIYSTNFKRTLHTAEPLATALDLRPVVVDHEPEAVVQKIRSHQPSDTALVVGHSDTVPQILKSLGCTETVEIADQEYDNLFIVVGGGAGAPVFLRLRY